MDAKHVFTLIDSWAFIKNWIEWDSYGECENWTGYWGNLKSDQTIPEKISDKFEATDVHLIIKIPDRDQTVEYKQWCATGINWKIIIVICWSC